MTISEQDGDQVRYYVEHMLICLYCESCIYTYVLQHQKLLKLLTVLKR